MERNNICQLSPAQLYVIMELLYIFYNTINTTTCGLWAFEVYDQELTFKFHLILTTSNFQGCIWLEAFILNIDWVGFPTGSDGKELACNAGDRVLPLGWKDPWRREYSSILAWRIPWTEEPGYSPWSCRESDVTEWLTCTHINKPHCKHNSPNMSLGFNNFLNIQ